MKIKKRNKNVKSKEQTQDTRSLRKSKKVLQESTPKDKLKTNLLSPHENNEYIINCVNSFSDEFEVLGIEPILGCCNELNSKHASVHEVFDIQEVGYAYEFFKSNIFPQKTCLTLSTKIASSSEDNKKIEANDFVPASHNLVSTSKLQQKVGNKKKATTKRNSVKVEKNKELVYDLSSDCISKEVDSKKEILNNSSNNIKKLKVTKIHLEKNDNKAKIINCLQKVEKTKELNYELSSDCISKKIDSKKEIKSNNSKNIRKLKIIKIHQEINNNKPKIINSLPKCEKTKELSCELSSDDVSNEIINKQDTLNKKANDLKNLKITICNNKESDKSKEKAEGTSFKNYDVIIKSSNISNKKFKLKRQSESKEISSQANKIPEFNITDNSYETPDKVSHTKCENGEKHSEDIRDNCLLSEDLDVPKDFLEQVKHMKVTLKDSKRTLKISPNSKTDSISQNLKRKHVSLRSKNITNSNALKVCQTDSPSIIKNKNLKFLDMKGESSCSSPAFEGSLPNEDDILSTILDKEVMLELQDEDKILSADEEFLCSKSCDASFPPDSDENYISRNYNMQLDYVNTNAGIDYDSESDSESSFKRKKTNNSLKQSSSYLNQGSMNSDYNCTTPDNCSISSLSSISDKNSSNTSISFNKRNDSVFSHQRTKVLDISSNVIQGYDSTSIKAQIFKTGNINEVLKVIEELCTENNIQKALFLSRRYLPIRSPEEKTNIFLSLFMNIMNSIKGLKNNLNSEAQNFLFDAVYRILQENNLYNPRVCTFIIVESFSSGLGISMAYHVFEQCVNHHIEILEEAIIAYADFLFLQEDMIHLLALSDYIRNVCNMQIPRYVLHYVLKLSILNFKDMLEPDFRKFCNILCNLNITDMDECYDCDIVTFFKCCIENDCWLLISDLFAVWVAKGLFPFVQNFYFALASSSESTGTNLEKFASALFGNSSVEQNQLCLFTQIAVSLMLEEYVNDNLDSALKVLMLLHKYNINYVELQVPTYQMYSSKLFPNPFSIFIFKETVIHTVVDILLHFERSKDAFDVSQASFETFLSNVQDSGLKTQLLLEKYTTVLKIAPFLISTDPFGRSLKALHNLLSIEEQGLTMESVEKYSKNVAEIYNRCLANLLNNEKLEMALELLDCKYGDFKEKLSIFNCVRRGLVVTCANNGMMEKANRLFYVGHIKKCYNLPKINKFEYPSYLCLKSCWSSHEIKFAIELYIQKLHPFFLSKDKGKPMKCFSIRMRVKPHSVESQLVNCLQGIPSDYLSCENRIKDILPTMDPRLSCINREIKAKACMTKCLEIPPDIFYDYWKSKLPSPVKININKDVSVNVKKRISFGISEPERNAEDFKKITQFLIAKLFFKQDDLNAADKQRKAERLAISFIRKNQVLNKLDKKSMKLLNEFSEKLIKINNKNITIKT